MPSIGLQLTWTLSFKSPWGHTSGTLLPHTCLFLWPLPFPSCLACLSQRSKSLCDYEPTSSLRGMTGELGEGQREESERGNVVHWRLRISLTDLWLFLTHTRRDIPPPISSQTLKWVSDTYLKNVLRGIKLFIPLKANIEKYAWIRAVLRCEHTWTNLGSDTESHKDGRENPRVVLWRRKEDIRGEGPGCCQFCICVTILYN